MTKDSSSEQEVSKQFKKIVQNYTISYCNKQFLGKSLYGQVRLGYETTQKRVRAFRINALPLSQQSRTNLQLQKYYSKLVQCCCTVYESVESQSNRYTVMQYFPKTFRTELAYFRKLTKNMEPFIQKFLQTYAKLFYYRIAHGNLSIDNIGITFDGRVKLMDFRPVDKLNFQQASAKDYRDFKNIMCFILEKDKKFPHKLQVFEDQDGDWIKLFSVWHVINVYQYIYREKKEPFQNICVLLSKLENSIYPSDNEQGGQQNSNPCIIEKQNMTVMLRVAIRLLILSNLKRLSATNKKAADQANLLQKIIGPDAMKRISFYNSIIWGCINDAEQYGLHQAQRLTLIACLIPFLNHEYYYMEILKQFDPSKENVEYFQIYGDSLIKNYSHVMKQNIIFL